MARGLQLACVILLFFGSLQQSEAVSVAGSLFSNSKTAAESVAMIKDNIDNVKNFFTGGSPPADSLPSQDIRMLNGLYEIENNMEIFKEQLFQKVSQQIASKLDLLAQPLLNKIDQVNILYRGFMKVLHNIKRYNLNTVTNFAEDITSHKLSELSVVVVQLHTLLYNTNFMGESILSILSEGVEHNFMCGKNQSSQQLINELYKTVVYSDLKCVTMAIFAYEIKRISDKTSYQFEIEQELNGFYGRIEMSFSKVADAMKKASRDVWRCDPLAFVRGKQVVNHKKGVTYSTLQEIFQSTLIYERDIDQTCFDQCSDHKYAENQCNSEYCKTHKKPCRYSLFDNETRGVVRDCMDMSDRINLCYAPANSERLYDWSRTKEDLIYGRDRDSCSNKSASLAWEYPIAGQEKPTFTGSTRHCNFCLCTCEDTTILRPRYFSLREAKSAPGHVITGVQLYQKRNVFYIRIQEGKLLADGTIESAKWQAITNVFSDKYLQEYIPYDNDPDLYKVQWHTRTVYLDDIEVPNHFLTGLRFKKVKDLDMKLEAEFAKYNYATDKLENHQWHSFKKQRSTISLKDADDPLRHINDAIYSNPGSSVKFQITSIVKDMGQLTVPFLDTQEVVSDPPVPISGVSLFLKGTHGSGGLLAFKLTQSYSKPTIK